jgi:multiple sugar transport system permease protein
VTEGQSRPDAQPVARRSIAARRRGRQDVGREHPLIALLWIGPALALILGVVVWPAIEMLRTSVSEISVAGLLKGSAGFNNYATLFGHPSLNQVVLQTVVWVLGVVGVTLLISMALAQLLNQSFPGRRLVRWAVIVPWAASVVMTATVWRWMLDFFYGTVNRVLTDVQLLDRPIDWLGEPTLAFAWMMWVAVFVSLPFTTYVILAGLQAVPVELTEAARVDGASSWQTYRTVVLPLLRPALLVGTVINIINVFNSFPIIWVMTQGGPGNATDTTTTFMYKLAFFNQEVGVSAAMAVLNFCLILVVVLAYLRVVRWKEE